MLSLPLKKRRFLQAVGVFADADDASHSSKTILEADPLLSRLNILVVDDNIVNRRVCVAQLQNLGVWSISEAEDGRQAIAAAQNQAFDLILMDVQMPEIDVWRPLTRFAYHYPILIPNSRESSVSRLMLSARTGKDV